MNINKFNFACLNCGFCTEMTLESQNFNVSPLNEYGVKGYHINCAKCVASFDITPESLLYDNFNSKEKMELELETFYSSAATDGEKEFYRYFLEIRKIDSENNLTFIE